MLLNLITFGLIPAEAGEPGTDRGPITAPAEQIAVVPSVQGVTAIAAGIPLGVAAWSRPFDPADLREYAIDFSAQLRDGEQIASIQQITMSATGALLGVGISADEGYGPIIGNDGNMVQVYFAVDPAYWEELSFLAGGLKLPVSFRVLTDSTPPNRIERSGVLTVRQQ